MESPARFCLDCGYPIEGLAARGACPECGRLFDMDDPSTYSVDVAELVKLYASGNPVDVYLLRDTLAEEGIRAVVVGEMLGMARGDLPMTAETLPAVWVAKGDAERAMRIALEYDRAKADAKSRSENEQPWQCPNCGEEVDAPFETCWNCGRERVPSPES